MFLDSMIKKNSGNDSRLAIERNPKTCLMTEQDSNTGDNPWWHMETDKIYKITELSIISSPGYLQQGRMNIMSNEECRNYLADSVATMDALNYKNILDINTLFCAGSIPILHGITICNEDNGSALVCKDQRGIWTQVVIVNFFFKSQTGQIFSNSIFTSVGPHLDFVYEVLEKGKYLQSKADLTQEKKLIFVFVVLCTTFYS